MRKLQNFLVTGGAGFIGSHFIKQLFHDNSFCGRIINVDCLTYAANPDSLCEIQNEFGNSRYFFEKINICDSNAIDNIFSKYDIDTVVHFAAETHVDRSIISPETFIQTNINGTFNLLESARKYWKSSLQNKPNDKLFHYISTDEVYGQLGSEGYFTESSPINPKSPYSASKASAQMLVLSYLNTYGLPVTISNCSNNYGPFQNQEKLIPHTIKCILNNEKIPVYGNGKNVRDWIYVEDHNNAVNLILQHGKSGECYNIGGENDISNIDLISVLIKIIAPKINKAEKDLLSFINFVQDRPGHDFRYAIDCSKIKNELGWSRNSNFEKALEITIDWYLQNQKTLFQ